MVSVSRIKAAEDLAEGDRIMLKDLRVLEVTRVKVMDLTGVRIWYDELATKTTGATLDLDHDQQVKIIWGGWDAEDEKRATLAELI